MTVMLLFLAQNLLLHLNLFPVIKCFLITPRSFPDSIDFFEKKPNNQHGTAVELVPSEKPWLAYTQTFLANSVSSCSCKSILTSILVKMFKCTQNFAANFRKKSQLEGCPEEQNIQTCNSRSCVHETLATGSRVLHLGKCTGFAKFPVFVGWRRYQEPTIHFAFFFRVDSSLQINITFTELHMTQDEQVLFSLHGRYSLFKLNGQRPKTTVIPKANIVVLTVKKNFNLDSQKFLFQMTDSNTVKAVPIVSSKYSFVLFFVWKEALEVGMFTIKVPLYLRLAVTLKHQRDTVVHIHDGPGIFSDQIKQNHSLVHLSTFQAFVVIYALTWPENPNTSFGISFVGKKSELIELVVSHAQTVVLPPCPTPKAQKHSESKQWRRATDRNIHCVYNITPEAGYLNVSISTLTYSGYNFNHNTDRKSMEDCSMGGVAFYITDEFTNQPRAQYLCKNLSSSFATSENYKIIPSIVSNSKDSIIFVVYSYKYYSDVMVKVTLSLTPCIGYFGPFFDIEPVPLRSGDPAHIPQEGLFFFFV